MTETLAFAFAAGLVAAVNPCGFALLPAYLSLVVLGDSPERRTRGVAVLRALAATAMMTLGFLAVFGAFGLLVAPVATSAQRYLPAITVVIGVALVGLGCWLLTGRELRVLLPKPKGGAPGDGLRSMALYGVAYALASLSCTIAPFLAVTAGTFRTGDTLAGVAVYAAYAAGMGLLVGVLAVAVALAKDLAKDTVTGGLRRTLPYVNRISGVLLVIVGGYVTYYGVYEIRLFNFDGDPSDPIVSAAGLLQSALVSTVDSLGWPPLVAALTVLVVAGVVLSRLAAGRRAVRRD